MIDYLKRVGIFIVALSFAVFIIGAIVGAFILWVKLGEALIPVDVTYHNLRVILYVVVSIIIGVSLLMALDKDSFK